MIDLTVISFALGLFGFSIGIAGSFFAFGQVHFLKLKEIRLRQMAGRGNDYE